MWMGNDIKGDSKVMVQGTFQRAAEIYSERPSLKHGYIISFKITFVNIKFTFSSGVFLTIYCLFSSLNKYLFIGVNL